MPAGILRVGDCLPGVTRPVYDAKLRRRETHAVALRDPRSMRAIAAIRTAGSASVALRRAVVAENMTLTNPGGPTGRDRFMPMCVPST